MTGLGLTQDKQLGQVEVLSSILLDIVTGCDLLSNQLILYIVKTL